MKALPPLGLYLHLPWCRRRCPYCDFNAHALRGPLPARAYVEALLRDLEGELPRVWGRRVRSLFLGGGTPSLFPPEAVDRLLEGLRALLPLDPEAEITLEANPGTVDRARLEAYRAAGVNRLSLGVQSFQDRLLRALGRIHDARQAREAAAAAREAGFARLNLDLMWGLPGQDPAAALADVEQALAFDPGHLSHYQLTLEPGTPFHRRPPPLPGEEALEAMEAACAERLLEAGYRRYEVSAWAREGQRCRHNLNYWLYGDYLGLGAGAHGKLSLPAAGGEGGALRILRTRRPADPQAFLARPGPEAQWEVPPREAAFECLLNGLRLVEGLPEALLEERTGLPLQALAQPLARARERGLLERGEGRLRPTPLGLRHLNTLQLLFLPEEEAA
ncbi:MAG: radical SAM family heme chaperone HemW [Gammaproteobacteria bacterium]|nr:MAG: radical SAM family heme chaperone HemW [Gammaproteobacteria bacterium]